MKLASLKGGRDGRLVVVSNDVAWFADAGHIAPTLQYSLDHWWRIEPELRGLAEGLEHGAVPKDRFHEHSAASPLPRSHQWVKSANGAEPVIGQGGSDSFLGPRDQIPLGDEAWDLDLEPAVAVIVGDVPIGASGEQALAAIRLVMLCNDVSLRALMPGEIAQGHGLYQSKPASAFSPVAITPNALAGWQGGRLSGALELELNGQPFAAPDAGAAMAFDFGRLIAHAAKTRALSAGTIVSACVASSQGAEATRTPRLKAGDVVRLEMRDARRHTIFGAIEQEVRSAQ
jgi:fumarylacetoacetate (FAA) hydrolase